MDTTEALQKQYLGYDFGVYMPFLANARVEAAFEVSCTVPVISTMMNAICRVRATDHRLESPVLSSIKADSNCSSLDTRDSTIATVAWLNSKFATKNIGSTTASPKSTLFCKPSSD
jgi:hypothetical protein